MKMEVNFKTYPKNGTHLEKNLWKERFEKFLRERQKGFYETSKWISIQELLGESMKNVY